GPWPLPDAARVQNSSGQTARVPARAFRTAATLWETARFKRVHAVAAGPAYLSEGSEGSGEGECSLSEKSGSLRQICDLKSRSQTRSGGVNEPARIYCRKLARTW